MQAPYVFLLNLIYTNAGGDILDYYKDAAWKLLNRYLEAERRYQYLLGLSKVDPEWKQEEEDEAFRDYLVLKNKLLKAIEYGGKYLRIF